jgi:hypothetical protein
VGEALGLIPSTTKEGRKEVKKKKKLTFVLIFHNFEYSWPSLFMVSASSDSTHCRSKTLNQIISVLITTDFFLWSLFPK